MENVQVFQKSSFCFMGMKWSGTYEAAAHGQVYPLFRTCQEYLKGHLDPGQSLIGLAYHDRPGGFTYYLGVEVDRPESMPDGLERILVPAYSYVTMEHSGPNAWISYERLYRWVEQQGYLPVASGLDHLDVYPFDYDPMFTNPVMTIGIPVKHAKTKSAPSQS